MWRLAPLDATATPLGTRGALRADAVIDAGDTSLSGCPDPRRALWPCSIRYPGCEGAFSGSGFPVARPFSSIRRRITLGEQDSPDVSMRPDSSLEMPQPVQCGGLLPAGHSLPPRGVPFGHRYLLRSEGHLQPYAGTYRRVSSHLPGRAPPGTLIPWVNPHFACPMGLPAPSRQRVSFRIVPLGLRTA